MEYKLEEMRNMNDTVSYNIVFHVTKTDGKWYVEQPDEEVLEAIEYHATGKKPRRPSKPAEACTPTPARPAALHPRQQRPHRHQAVQTIAPYPAPPVASLPSRHATPAPTATVLSVLFPVIYLYLL